MIFPMRRSNALQTVVLLTSQRAGHQGDRGLCRQMAQLISRLNLIHSTTCFQSRNTIIPSPNRAHHAQPPCLVSKVYNDHYQSSLYETWHIVVQARLRMDVHSLLGQQSPADLVVRGDRYSRKVRAFSSAPAEVSFEPPNAFQLVPGGYNR